MKVLSLILKIIETGMTCIWGVFFGIVFPVCILCFGNEIMAEDIANSPVIVVWLIVSAVGYVLPAALIICRRTKTAAVMSVLGFVGLMVVSSMFAELYKYTEGSSGPTDLYLPLIIVTILDIFIAVIDNIGLIKAKFEKSRNEKEQTAPSILSDD